MRKALVLLSLLILFCCAPLLAQDKPEDVPAVEKRSALNFFGGLLAEPSLVNHKVAFSLGATMGLTLFDHFYAGGYYLSLVSEIYRDNIPSHGSIKLRCSLNHGGFMLGYVWKPQSIYNINFYTRVGWGRIWYYDPKESNSDVLDTLYKDTRDNVCIITPGVEFTITPVSWMRLGFGMGYRIMAMITRYSWRDYTSPVGTISVSFGSFQNKKEDKSVTEPEL